MSLRKGQGSSCVQPSVMPRSGMPGLYTNKLHYFKKHLLEEITKKKFAIDFMEPVDTEALQVPTYYAIIEHPMDVGTIIKRVQNNYYRGVSEAIADFKLIIRNCFTFNREGDVVYRKGQMLEKFFTKKINEMPSGLEVPCNKDPRALRKPRAGMALASASASTQKTCRDYLKKLQTFSDMTDTRTRKFFTAKWDSLLKKVDKHYFKTVDEFKAHVDGIFKKYHAAAYMIYECAFEQRDAHPKNQYKAISLAQMEELAALCKVARETEHGMRRCMQPPQIWEQTRGKQLLDNFAVAIDKMKQRIDSEERGGGNLGASWIFAHAILSESELQELITVYTDSDDDEEEEEDGEEPVSINDEERRSIQLLFAKMSLDYMHEILHQIQQIEGFVTEVQKDRLSFDVMNFKPHTLLLMKKAIAKTMKASTKLNLRDMPQKEKLGLQRNLEEQLEDITMKLNGGRGKLAKGPRTIGSMTISKPELATASKTKKRALSDSSESEKADDGSSGERLKEESSGSSSSGSSSSSSGSSCSSDSSSSDSDSDDSS